MSEDVTVSLREADYKIFGIVGERDDVFMRLMHKMKDEIGLPISGISLTILWVYMTRIGVKITDIQSIVQEKDFVKEKLLKLGNLNRDEKIVAGIFISTSITWITRGLIWKDLLPAIDDSTIVLVSAISISIAFYS